MLLLVDTLINFLEAAERIKLNQNISNQNKLTILQNLAAAAADYQRILSSVCK